MSGLETTAYRNALALALGRLGDLLTEAQECVYSPKYPDAVIGVLCDLDSRTDDLKAALRLYTNARRAQ